MQKQMFVFLAICSLTANILFPDKFDHWSRCQPAIDKYIEHVSRAPLSSSFSHTLISLSVYTFLTEVYCQLSLTPYKGSDWIWETLLYLAGFSGFQWAFMIQQLIQICPKMNKIWTRFQAFCIGQSFYWTSFLWRFAFLLFHNIFLCRLKFSLFFKHSAMFIYKCFKTHLLKLKYFFFWECYVKQFKKYLSYFSLNTKFK